MDGPRGVELDPRYGLEFRDGQPVSGRHRRLLPRRRRPPRPVCCPSRTRSTPRPCPTTSSASLTRHDATGVRRAAAGVPRGDAPAARRVPVEARADPPVAGAVPARGDPRDPRGDRRGRPDRDWDHLREELGDLLLQVYFHAVVAEERGAFTIDDVARGITEKMRRRNPHVFGRLRRPAARRRRGRRDLGGHQGATSRVAPHRRPARDAPRAAVRRQGAGARAARDRLRRSGRATRTADESGGSAGLVAEAVGRASTPSRRSGTPFAAWLTCLPRSLAAPPLG